MSDSTLAKQSLNMEAFFTATGYADVDTVRSVCGKHIDFTAIPPILRVLLSTDGTVTKTLESYFWEPVKVQLLAQEQRFLQQDDPVLHLSKETPIMERQVSLVGSQSNHHYAHAESIVIPSYLPKQVAAALSSEKMGIGEVLRTMGMETYREIIGFNLGDEEVSRCYLIWKNAKPIMQVTETFPLALYTEGQK